MLTVNCNFAFSVPEEPSQTKSYDLSAPPSIGGKVPQFTKLLENVEVFEDTPAKLLCWIEGIPTPRIEWLKDGSLVKPDNRVKTSFDGETCILEFVTTEADDEAEYECVARNELGKTFCTAELLVNEALNAPDFTEKMADVEVGEGEEARFDVRVDARPHAKVEWFKGLKEIPDTGRFVHIDAVEEDHFALIIEHAEPSDAGNYKCVAKNDLGDVVCFGKLKVVEKPKEAKKKPGDAPEIVKALEKIEVVEGKPSKLECEITGKPTPTIEWFKDDEKVKEDRRVKTDFVGQLCSLRITKTNAEDEAEYKCVATNEHGTASTSAELLVNEPDKRPEFTEKMKPVDVTEGEEIRFEVRVTGKPTPEVEWFRGKEKISKTERFEPLVDDMDKFHHFLVIRESRVEDATSYKCVAKNVVSEASCRAAVVVKEKTVAPVFEGPVEEAPFVVTEGEEVNLDVGVKAKPKPDVTWYKDGKRLRDTNRIKLKSKDDKFSLVIKDAKPEDSGKYKCEAKNKAGTKPRTFDVNVEGMQFSQGQAQ